MASTEANRLGKADSADRARATPVHQRRHPQGLVTRSSKGLRRLWRLLPGWPDAFYRGERSRNESPATSNKWQLHSVTCPATEPRSRRPWSAPTVVFASSRRRRPQVVFLSFRWLHYLGRLLASPRSAGRASSRRACASTMGRYRADRRRYLADPKFSDVRWTAARRSYAGKRGDRVLRRARGGRPLTRPARRMLCVVDHLGNAVSMTHTPGSSSGVVTESLGFGCSLRWRSPTRQG